MNPKLGPQQPPSGLVPCLELPNHCSFENKYVFIVNKLSR